MADNALPPSETAATEAPAACFPVDQPVEDDGLESSVADEQESPGEIGAGAVVADNALPPSETAATESPSACLLDGQLLEDDGLESSVADEQESPGEIGAGAVAAASTATSRARFGVLRHRNAVNIAIVNRQDISNGGRPTN